MSLFDHQACDEPEAPHDRGGLDHEDVIVLYVDKGMLAGSQNRLIDFVQTKSGHASRIRNRFPEFTIRALAVLLDLASKPYMCSSKFKEDGDDATKTKRRTKKRARASVPPSSSAWEDQAGEEAADGEGGEGGGEEEDAVEKNLTWTYEAKSMYGDESKRMNRMEVYYETILNAEETSTRGWCFYFLIYDRSLCFDDGLGFHAKTNAKRASKRGPAPEFWQWEACVEDWIRFGVSPYCDMRFTTERRGVDPGQVSECRDAFGLPLSDPRNPARTNKVFTFESSRAGWDADSFCGDQLTAESYFNSEGAFERFPRKARWIPPTMRHPKQILFGLMERPAYVERSAHLDAAEILMSQSVGSFLGKAANEESPDKMMSTMAKSFGELVKTHEDRRNPECAIRFESWVASEACPPGIQACWEHMREFIASKRSAVASTTCVVDESLSDFGNAVAWEMLVIENLFAASYMHTDLLFDYINAGGAFRYKRTLRLHTLCLGPAASGKSWKQEMLVRLLAPNTSKAVGHQTKRSDTTNTNRDCTIRIMDEAREVMSDQGEDGSGSAEFKQILTSGVTHTEQCVVDTELKTRETMEIISHLLVLVNANSNAAVERFPAPIISRFMVRYVPVRHRKDMTDPTLRENISKFNFETPVVKEEIARHQTRHALVGLVTHAIDVGWLPEVDMDYAIVLLDTILENLQKNGVTPDARSKQRLPLYMRALTIWFAVYMVFQTNEHLAPGTPFETKQLLLCAPYLRCSRELVYFAVTHMYDTLINVNAPTVCKAIKAIVERDETNDISKHPKRAKSDRASAAAKPAAGGLGEHETSAKGAAARPAATTTTGGLGEYDTSVYLLRLPLMGTRDEDIIGSAVKKIATEIEKSDTVMYSEEMVRDTLRWMMSQTVKTTEGHLKPSVKMVRSPFDEFGMTFNVEMIDGDAVNHVLNAVKASMDDWVRGTDKRFVTGITFREGIKAEDDVFNEVGDPVVSVRMFPHLFRTFDASRIPRTHEDFIIRNPDYKEHGYHTLFLNESESMNTTKPYLVLRLDLDEDLRKKRLEEFGLEDARAYYKKDEDGGDPERVEFLRGDVPMGFEWAHRTVLGAQYPGELAHKHTQRFETWNYEVVGGGNENASPNEEASPSSWKRARVAKAPIVQYGNEDEDEEELMA